MTVLILETQRQKYESVGYRTNIKKCTERKRMDIRSQKTREAIFDSFFMLLSEKSFQHISVSEIITKARIGRSTFYAHFPSKDDLLTATTQQLFEHVFEKSSYAEHMNQMMPDDQSLLDMLTHLFQHFKENQDKVTTLFKSGDDYFFRSLDAQLQTYLVPIVMPLYFKEHHLPENLIKHFISSVFINTLDWWLRQKQEITSRAVSFYYLQLLA